ncbi:hypothetical protein IMG5_156020 [Ichthyophthirius multifiliis]|uniref:CRAL-TRIO domain-containing protein n=1 Tax=Ichthyophthirius multifiliis TaxID=5932 RepID=G0QZE0_ICHMU|nr:hypothetical protein IMG5_156020 [Ichthyophthirius multifiliis]EGR29409.1 hypothetical protein IMG5_156020 [Ichthyophthirius multifiliis]|eukprot:XP_004030645.1 hypothetical protein IMG5_156020 [Ichthyophthirius multifiliis]
MTEEEQKIQNQGKTKIAVKPPIVQKIGTKKTGWCNFIEICKKIKRDPVHVQQFFMSELGTDASIASEYVQNYYFIFYYYLIPSQQAVCQIQHDDYYIKHGEKKKICRKIYEGIEYDQFEKQQIQEFIQYVSQHNKELLNQSDSTYLKILQSGQFNHKKALKVIQIYLFIYIYNYIKKKNLEIHIQWKNNPDMHSLDQPSLNFLKEGTVYLAGRDKKYRPVLIMDCSKLNMKKQTGDSLIRAMSYFLNIIKKHMFVNGKIENWIFIIDVKEKGIFDLPLKALNIIIQTMQINFGGHLEKMFVLNPSFGLNTSWSIIEKMIDEEAAAKITFAKKGKMEKLYEQIPKEQVQKQYGGNMPNITQFWYIFFINILFFCLNQGLLRIFLLQKSKYNNKKFQFKIVIKLLNKKKLMSIIKKLTFLSKRNCQESIIHLQKWKNIKIKKRKKSYLRKGLLT